ncbi:unnamed protein product [Rotaria magnacalcarata]|uniref:Nucleosome assembly protein 1-like 1 n=1 Tax=Rotaria magnacalcarata TaxID=392030 RepID=A0A815BU16_9BILA|nr:unnamed protein product [Rotaria magnacalcarata]CAF1598857.1 unnamed protein product [Rotaria magnacalcarata]CAF2066121.1 unnamed protein product [Rotaria magnacalcarata]CAF2145076.1 unnamed protein product [Rotaria magnacalcarata]CAF3817668.1 unnamed protein product [Rotaria magnacalcarata]
MDKKHIEQLASSKTAGLATRNAESTQQQIDSIMDDDSFYSGSLPAEVLRRVNALRNLQLEHHNIEANFFEEVHTLECRYLIKYQQLYEKRCNIIKGIYEPTDTEAKCAFDGEDNDEETTKPAEDEKKGDKVVGIPEFWSLVLKNSDVISELIKEQDNEILKHLVDIRLKMQDETKQKGFTIEFEFTPNEYFTNTILTKSYELRMGLDEHDPLQYEGPEIVKSIGCQIQWNKGKNVTVKTIKKKQKHKNRGTVRVVTKEVQTDSFFNFFSPPNVPEGSDAGGEDTDEVRMLAADFEMGHLLRDSIIPKAVLYYTGEVDDGDDENYDAEEDNDEGDGDDDDQDEDDKEDHETHSSHHHHHASGGKHGSGGKTRRKKQPGAGGSDQLPECQQQ